jgi:hypothetical protein
MDEVLAFDGIEDQLWHVCNLTHDKETARELAADPRYDAWLTANKDAIIAIAWSVLGS